MDLNNISTMTYAAPPASVQEAGAPLPEKAIEAFGVGSEFGSHLSKEVAAAFNTTASELEDIGAGVRVLGPEIGTGANETSQALDEAVGALRADAAVAGRAGKALGAAGKVFAVADAGFGAYHAYEHSDARTLPGKLADGALGAGSKLLATAALPVAAVDLVTDGSVSGLFRAGGKSIAAMAQAAMGDVQPVLNVNEDIERGEYGSIAKSVHDGMLYLTR